MPLVTVGEALSDIDSIEAYAKDLPQGTVYDLPKPMLKSELLGIENLKEGMVMTGVVRNVIDFGAFVDISVHQDGLVHISEISKDYIKHPSEVLKVGDVVKVKVLSVDLNKKRIALTIKGAVDDEINV